MTPEGIGSGFGEPPKDKGGKENFSTPGDVGRQDGKEVVNSGVEPAEEKKDKEVLPKDVTEVLPGEVSPPSKEGDLEPATKDEAVEIGKEVSSEEETEVLTGEVFTPGEDGNLEPVSKDGSAIDFSKKEPAVGGTTAKHEDVTFEDKEEYPEDPEEKPESVLINEIKEAVKTSHVLDMGESEERKVAAKQVLKIARISGVDDLRDLLAARSNKNVNQEGISRKVDQLGVAISKAIEEVGSPEMKRAVEAGSFSTEKILPEAWRIVVEGDERDQSLARVIVDGAIESKVVNIARRDAISNEMESVDFYLNNPQYGLLEGQIEASIVSLRAMSSPSRVKEMNFISEKIAYLQGLKDNISNKNVKNDSEKEDAAEAPSDAVEVEPDSEEVTEPEAEVDSEEVTEPDITDVDGRVIIENRHGDGKEYRSPYEVTPVSFVDSCFNGENPRLFFTPAPEWVGKLPSKEQYLLKIQQKLAKGAEYKMGVQSIDAAKARQNEVYNLPTTELKLIYEMPYTREAMETFVNDLFEFYSEDGRQYLRLKLSKKDGVLEMKNGKPVLDENVAKKVGDIGTGGGFEDYKEEMFKTMALKRLYPTREADIIDSWKSVYDEVIRDYQVEARKNPRNKNKTDAELEHEWVSRNALEEKRAVATAWNFLYVGNIIESADIYRHLKPTQIGADKIRTMFRPGEKGVQKGGLRGEALTGSEEGFGRGFLYMKRMSETLGQGFMNKVVKALDNDRQSLSKEELQWRFLPKRMMCGFPDMYVVKTEDGDHMTFSEALMHKKKMVFNSDDADVFVYLRDVWDEVITVTPFLIGKAEYTPLQQPDKFASAIEKWRGLVTGYENIRITDPKEIDRRRSEMIKKKVPEDELWKANFGHGVAVDAPELYAWLLANTIGLELNFDIPVLDMAAMKVDRDTYDVGVKKLIRLMDLTPGQASEVKRILNAQGWRLSRNAIRDATRRAEKRESKRVKVERRR